MAVTRSWPKGPRYRLPRTVTPFPLEAATSYTDRLAHANHISIYTMRSQVAESCNARLRPDWLAIVSGQPEQVIRARLIGLVGDPIAIRQNLRRILYRMCLARKGIQDPVYCCLPTQITVCQRHQRWIGLPAHHLDDQVDLHDRPQVLSAGRRHEQLARQHPQADLCAAVSPARHILVFWTNAEQQLGAEVLQSGVHAYVAAYPAVVVIAATVPSVLPLLQQPSTPRGLVVPTRLLDHINERTGARHRDTTPLEQWVQTNA